MNEKQVKLLRYFVKNTGDLALAGAIKARWSTFDHKKKGQLTNWLKHVIVTMMHVAKEKKQAQYNENKKVLDNFFASPILDKHGQPIKA